MKSGCGAAVLAVTIAVLSRAVSACDLSTSSFPKTCTTTQDGLERCWLTFVPDTVNETATASAPLVINMHGYGGCATDLEYTGWQGKAQEVGMVLVLPQGLLDDSRRPSTAWNSGDACCFDSQTPPDDMSFLRKVVEQTLDTVDAADPSRVVIAGHSNGCAMAQRFALEASDLATVVACHSFYALVPTPDSYKTAIPVGLVHGSGDSIVPFDGNRFFNWPSSAKNLEDWATRNDCTSGLISKNLEQDGVSYERQSYTCNDGNEVLSIVMPDLDDSLFIGSEVPNPDHVPFGVVPGFFDTTTMLYDWAAQYKRENGKIVSSDPLTEENEDESKGTRTSLPSVAFLVLLLCQGFRDLLI